MIRIALGVSLALGIAASAPAQTLTLMKGIDAPHYDAQRTSWGPTSDIVNMAVHGLHTEAERAERARELLAVVGLLPEHANVQY